MKWINIKQIFFTEIPCTKKFTTNPVLSLKKEKTKRLLQLQPGPLLDVVRTTQSGQKVLKNEQIAAADDKVVSQLGLSQRLDMEDEEFLLKIKARRRKRIRESIN